MARKKDPLMVAETLEDLAVIAMENEIDISEFNEESPIDDVREFIRAAIQAKEDGEVLSTQNDGEVKEDGAPPVDEEPSEKKQDAGNQTDRGGAGEAHAAPDNNEEVKHAAMQAQDVPGAIKYIAGVIFSQSEMEEFKKSFPNL